MTRLSHCELMLLQEISHPRLSYCGRDAIDPQLYACPKTLRLQGILRSQLSRPFRDLKLTVSTTRVVVVWKG